MKLLLLLLAATFPLAAEWSDVMHLSPGDKVEVRTNDGAKVRSEFVSATADSLSVKDKTVQRSEIQEVKVYDSGRRIRRGVLWTIIGAAAGAGAGFAACPGCANEGHGGRYVGPGVAGGAAIGTLGFLSSPWKRVYK
ncbi:MAG TPA: hypothetical protein VHC90_21760 [Bryobacteraceae bacterium]|nr:hypothetical protein [Bryobacteraceae bacterium]